MLQVDSEPGRPQYAAFVCGFRYQLLRIGVGGFFGCPAYSAA
jgi:hypothetical protein